jgi:hypothetical protein
MSIVLSAFPVLSARDGTVFDRTCAGSTRAVLLVACLGMSVIAAVSIPAAQVLSTQPFQVPQLVEGFVMFAPGLVGAGVLANVTRALLAIGQLRVACVGVAGSSLLAAVAQIVLAEVVPTNFVVGALSLGNSIGMIGAAIPMVIITRRIRGRAAVEGVGRTTLTGVAAAAVSAVAGVSVCLAWPTTHKVLAIIVGMFAAAAAVIAFGAVAYVLDNGDLRVVVARLAQVLRIRSAGQDGEIDQDTVRRPALTMPARLSAMTDLISRALRRLLRRQLLRMRTTRQVRDMSTADQTGTSNENRHEVAMMTRLERRWALAIGLAAGIAGGIAVFATSNQAGTAFLLLISLVFLVMGVEGTPLLRILGVSADSLRLRLGNKARQHADGAAPATVTPADEPGADMSYDDRVMAALTDEGPGSSGPADERFQERDFSR